MNRYKSDQKVLTQYFLPKIFEAYLGPNLFESNFGFQSPPAYNYK